MCIHVSGSDGQVEPEEAMVQRKPPAVWAGMTDRAAVGRDSRAWYRDTRPGELKEGDVGADREGGGKMKGEAKVSYEPE